MTQPNIVCIIQARMSSTRLPGKVMLPLAGKPVIEQVFNQLSFSKKINLCILATSTDPSDNPLEEWAIKTKHNCYRGNLDNVLERFIMAAKQYKADVIVRITADCPLIDPEVVDETIMKYMDGNYDYFSNADPPTFPDGLDTEVFSYSALERSYREASLKSEIEHVTPYIRNHPEIFKIGNYASEVNYESHRWTLDNPEDYKFIQKIYDNLFEKGKYISWNSVLKLLKANQSFMSINKHIHRNEGFDKSLKEDNKI